VVYQPKLGDLVAENAQFQAIVKSFALEHLLQAEPSCDGLDRGFVQYGQSERCSGKKDYYFGFENCVNAACSGGRTNIVRHGADLLVFLSSIALISAGEREI